MRGIGVHVCEECGQVYETIGDYLNCVEEHRSMAGSSPTMHPAQDPVSTRREN